MSFAYADFEDIVPGGTVAAVTDHANEARLALLERATAISVDISGVVPAAISPGATIQLSWLTGMRSAVDTMIAADKLGRLSGAAFVPWTLATLLTEVHASFTDCGAGSGWISVAQGDPLLAVQIREVYYACEVLTFVEDTATVKASDDTGWGSMGDTVILTAELAGAAGNDITWASFSWMDPLTYEEVGSDITIKYPALTTCADVVALINTNSTLVTAAGGSLEEIDSANGQLTGGLDAETRLTLTRDNNLWPV